MDADQQEKQAALVNMWGVYQQTLFAWGVRRRYTVQRSVHKLAEEFKTQLWVGLGVGSWCACRRETRGSRLGFDSIESQSV